MGLNAPDVFNFNIDTIGYVYTIATSSAIKRLASTRG